MRPAVFLSSMFVDRSAKYGVLIRNGTTRSIGLLLLWFVVGCQQKTNQAPSATLPAIPVSHPVQRKVTDFVDFTGRTDAKESVSVRAQVTGVLERIDHPFKEGSEVKAGDLLFKIDPKPYQAIVDQAQSQVLIYQTQSRLARLTYDRDRALGSTLATSQQQLDQDKAAMDAAEARIKAAIATLDAANVNLGYTTITAPISGRISRIFYTPGNLATANQTILTTIVSMDPMYAYFDIDERTYHRYVKAINEGKTKLPMPNAEAPDKEEKPANPVQMALEGEEGFPWLGNVDFINNQINPSTGTVAVRGVFRNKRPEGGTWRMVPGMFVRIRLPIGEAHSALLVIDRAIGSDQELKFVYVVDEENKVQYRRVITGPLQEDGLRVIEPYDAEKNTGLKPDDWVVVGGLPQLRPRTEIKRDPIPMPTLANTDAVSSSRGRPQPPPPGQNLKKQ